MFLSFRKNKETKCISGQISKKFKRVAVSLSKMCRSKIFMTDNKNSHFKIRKREKAKIEK